ncbi:hypothetical protein X979_4965 [Burkholderia pseudomallei MSHR7527]|nr:hypothetical protein X979_4965 [Burkholderia pseudomallei MSHR7527]
MNGCLAFRPRTESATTYKDAAVRRRSVPVTVSSNVHLVFNDVLCEIVLVFLVTVAARHALPNIVVQLFPRAGREFHRQIVNIEAKRAFVTQSRETSLAIVNQALGVIAVKIVLSQVFATRYQLRTGSGGASIDRRGLVTCGLRRSGGEYQCSRD